MPGALRLRSLSPREHGASLQLATAVIATGRTLVGAAIDAGLAYLASSVVVAAFPITALRDADPGAPAGAPAPGAR